MIQIDRQSPKVSNWKKAIADQFVSLFGKDKDLKEIKEKENLNVRLTLKFDGREAMRHSKDPEFGVSGRSRLEKTAEGIIAEYDEDSEAGFIIETFSGNKITAEEIRVSDTYKVKTLGKSISKVAAWNILKEYHDRLDSEGVFSQ